jgi:hypothetical protein
MRAADCRFFHGANVLSSALEVTYRAQEREASSTITAESFAQPFVYERTLPRDFRPMHGNIVMPPQLYAHEGVNEIVQ